MHGSVVSFSLLVLSTTTPISSLHTYNSTFPEIFVNSLRGWSRRDLFSDVVSEFPLCLNRLQSSSLNRRFQSCTETLYRFHTRLDLVSHSSPTYCLLFDPRSSRVSVSLVDTPKSLYSSPTRFLLLTETWTLHSVSSFLSIFHNSSRSTLFQFFLRLPLLSCLT